MRQKVKSIVEVSFVWDLSLPWGLINPPLKVQLLSHATASPDRTKIVLFFFFFALLGAREGEDGLRRSACGLRVASSPRKARSQTAIFVLFRVGRCWGPVGPLPPTGVLACAGRGLHVPSATVNSVFITRSVLNWEVNRAPSDKR